MPELPEVETTKASLAPLLDQQVLSVEVRQSSLRWPIPADLSKIFIIKSKKVINIAHSYK